MNHCSIKVIIIVDMGQLLALGHSARTTPLTAGASIENTGIT